MMSLWRCAVFAEMRSLWRCCLCGDVPSLQFDVEEMMSHDVMFIF
jgi:hypothetical protein